MYLIIFIYKYIYTNIKWGCYFIGSLDEIFLYFKMEYSNRKIRYELIYTFIQTSKGSVISSVIWAGSFHETSMENV